MEESRMNPEDWFKEMYYNIWQGHDISRLGDYYAKDFKEQIDTANKYGEPISLHLDYSGIIKQATFQKNNYENTTFNLIKLIADENHISASFYSTSIFKKTGELRHRCVCGIWHLNDEYKIDKVWAVVTPYYE
jgi:hypothetical protein